MMHGRYRVQLGWALLCALMLVDSGAVAQVKTALRGVIATEAYVTDAAGRPIWAYIPPDADDDYPRITVREVDICSEPGGNLLTVMAASDYHAAVDAYRAITVRHRVLTATEYRAQSFVNAAGQPVTKPALRPSTFSVVVRAPEEMRVASESLVLLEARIDLANIQEVDDEALSLLFGPCSKQGVQCVCAPGARPRILYSAPDGKIAYKTAYYIEQPQGNVHQTLHQFTPGIDTLLGPVQGASVSLLLSSSTSGYSRADGTYSVQYVVPYNPAVFPGGVPNPQPVLIYQAAVMARLNIDAFYPQTRKPRYFEAGGIVTLTAGQPADLGGNDYWAGGGPSGLPLADLLAAPPSLMVGTQADSTNVVFNLGLQVAMLTGVGIFRNEARPRVALDTPTSITIGMPTTYDARRGTFTPSLPPADMDLDGDGRADQTRLENGVVQVWLGDHTPGTDPPDLTRLPDRPADLKDRGLVSAISTADAELTDIFVYRLGTLQMVGSRRAWVELPNPPLWYDAPAAPEIGAGAEGVEFNMQFSGPRAFNSLRSLSGDPERTRYGDWAARTAMDEALIEQDRGHLTMGEPVKIYLINRATGYIGSALATVTGVSSRMTFRPAEPIVMRPPNLKVKAERTYEVTETESREGLLVGFEGGATSRDKHITISTEWVDHDGSPLPPDLPGFTGRIAKVIAPGVLGDAPGVLAQFGIEPGEWTEHVTIPDDGDIDAAHYYVHVHPQPEDRHPDFSASVQTGGRPARYVPILVPIYDEAETWSLRRALTVQAQQPVTGGAGGAGGAGGGGGSAEEPGEAEEDGPVNVHAWVYRPEMQFSVFDLKLREATRTTEDNQSVRTTLSEDQTHLLFSGTDERIDFLYTLLEDDLPVLSSVGPQRQLVFSLGGQEFLATVDGAGEIHFENVEQITELNSEDLFTLRLLVNGDDSNVLWELVMEYLAIDNRLIGDPREEIVEGELQVTPESNTVELQAVLLGYASRADADKDPRFRIDWTTQTTGGATASLTVGASDPSMGTSSAQLTVGSGRPGDTVTVIATLASDPTVRNTFEVVVRGGEPHHFANALFLGSVSAAGVGEAEAVIRCLDSWGNPVPDGTSIDMTLSGDAQLEYQAVTPPGGTPDPNAEGGPGTVDGEVRVTVRAGHIPTAGGARPQDESNEQATLSVRSGTITHEFAFDIHPLNIELEGDWNEGTPLAPAAPHTVTARVTDWQGNPVQGAQVTFAGTHAVLKSPVTVDGLGTIVATDATGRATASFGSGFRQVTDAKIFATVGYAGRQTLTYSVGNSNAPLDTSTALLVGNRTSAGSVDHTRPDDTVVGLRYETQADVTVRGAPGSSVDVQVGDLTDPNIQPVIALYMYELGQGPQGADLAPDENGLHDGAAEQIVVLDDSILGAGNSYAFRPARTFNGQQIPASRIVIDSAADMEMQDSVGFRVEVKPQSHGVPIFRHRDGVQRLSVDAAGHVVYSVRTRVESSTTHAYEVRSAAPIGLGAWHSIAGRFHNRQLELVVDGVASTSVAIPAGELLAQGSGPDELVIGDGFAGGMKSFGWYDWSAQPLVRIAGAASTQRVTFGPSGQATVRVESTGRLNAATTNPTMDTLRVAAIVTPVGGTTPAAFVSGSRQFVSLVSTEGYRSIAGSIVESQALYSDPNLPALGPIQFTAVDQSLLGRMVPTAHAQITLSNIWDIAKEVSTWLIPWNDALMLAEQIVNLITGSDDFSWSELIYASIGVLTIIPVLKPLKPLTNVLRKVFGLLGNGKFIKYLAGAMKQAVEFLVSKKGQRLLDVAPFLVIIGELAATQEGRDSVMFMANSIESADDLWGWITYFNLPMGGWAEGTEPPEVELLASASSGGTSDGFRNEYALGLAAVPVAHAQTNPRAARATKEAIQKALKGAAEAIQSSGGLAPTEFTAYLRILRANQKQISREVSQMLRDPKYLKMQMTLLAKKGQAAMKEAMQDKPDDRITVRQLAGLSAYLTLMRASGRFALTLDQITAIFVQCFVGTPSNKHGARFHLMMLAELHLTGEITGTTVSGSEVEVSIPFYKNSAQRLSSGTPLAPYSRRVDIVTQRADGTPVWWEVKSLARGAENRPDFAPWKLSESSIKSSREAGRGKYHREFVGDRVALLLRKDGRGPANFPTEVHWSFQKFETRSGQHGFERANATRAAESLCENPKASRDRIYGAFGKGPDAARRQCGAIRNPVGTLLDQGEQLTVGVRDIQDRLLGALDELSHLPEVESIVQQ